MAKTEADRALTGQEDPARIQVRVEYRGKLHQRVLVVSNEADPEIVARLLRQASRETLASVRDQTAQDPIYAEADARDEAERHQSISEEELDQLPSPIRSDDDYFSALKGAFSFPEPITGCRSLVYIQEGDRSVRRTCGALLHGGVCPERERHVGIAPDPNGVRCGATVMRTRSDGWAATPASCGQLLDSKGRCPSSASHASIPDTDNPFV